MTVMVSGSGVTGTLNFAPDGKYGTVSCPEESVATVSSGNVADLLSEQERLLESLTDKILRLQERIGAALVGEKEVVGPHKREMGEMSVISNTVQHNNYSILSMCGMVENIIERVDL